jgi:hypothetical protein
VVLLLSVIVGLIAWAAVALGVAVLLGRMCAKRDVQVCRPSPAELLHPAGSLRSSADAVRRSGR